MVFCFQSGAVRIPVAPVAVNDFSFHDPSAPNQTWPDENTPGSGTVPS